jgi:glycosyltransferase involved in cell wall biosynthesis
MRVGVYVAGYAPESGGGYTFERDILMGLLDLHRESKHTFSILCPARSSTQVQRDVQSTGLTVSSVPEERGLSRVASAIRRESPFLRAHWRRSSHLDHVARAAGVNFLWFVGAGIHYTDLPFLTVVWDLQHRVTPWFPEMSEKGLWDGRELSHGWFLQRATGVVSGTSVGQQELERFYHLPPERILKLPHPTPAFALAAADEKTDSGALAKMGISSPFILYPAQLWPHKNHVNLVMALQILRERHQLPLHLVLVGSDKGNRDHVMETAARCSVSEAVHVVGFVSRHDLIALYREAVTLAYVSWCGPENLPPLEAFALGCPVVASDIPGVREQLGDAAIFVKPGDPESIASGVFDMWRDQGTRDRLIKAGHDRAQKWTASHYVRGVFEFLNRFEPIARCWGSSK